MAHDPERLRNTFAEIHLNRLRDNLRNLKSSIPEGAFLCPMVKANAYGHGDLQVSKVLEGEGVSGLGVVLIEEGIRLRMGGVSAPIYYYGLYDSFGAEEIIRFNLIPVVSTWQQLDSLSRKLNEGDSFSVHVKFNTGMNRLGFSLEEAPAIFERFQKLGRLKLEGICTHFLNSDDFDNKTGQTQQQLAAFRKVQELFKAFPLKVHCLNSGALLSPLSKSGYGARPGITLYGAWPRWPVSLSDSLHLSQVMEVKSQVALVRKIKKGETVSYGGTWTAAQDSVIGVVPIGYADGYRRSFSNKGIMLVRGQRVSVIGRVCMDFTMVDLTNVARLGEMQVGEEVVVFGRQGDAVLTVDELAQLTDTIPYEILTGISSRVPRIFLH